MKFFISLIEAILIDENARMKVTLLPNDKQRYDLLEVVEVDPEDQRNRMLDALKAKGVDGTEPYKTV